MKRIPVLFVFLAFISVDLFPQLKSELKESFLWAETFVLYEEYSDALPLYQVLMRVYPENYNFKYRTGQCLLYIPGRKKQAIGYLEEAVNNINPKYREGKYREKGAPYDAYYYLANAYRINYQLDKAIETYQLFLKNMDREVYDTAVVNQQIRSCYNAKELMKTPLYIRRENLGNMVNDRYADLNPVVSGDETVMVYNKAEPFQDALYFTRKVEGKWSTPVNIIPDLGLGFEERNFATSLSYNGRELYIYRPGDDYDGNIFVTKRLPNDRWTTLEQLNENINTKYWESHATISRDGNKLYFTSNRKGTTGGLDIYISEKDSTGSWGAAVNLGPEINTVYNEESPFPGEDDNTIYFSSLGHFNMGGYDVFYSTKMDDGKWSIPVNAGYPLNTTDDDLFFNPFYNGYKAYYAVDDSTGYGATDIYRIEIFSKDHPRKFIIRGIVRVKDLLEAFRESVTISALSKFDPQSKVIVSSDPATGEYRLELPQGEYTMIFEAKDAEVVMKDLILPLTHDSDSILIPDVLMDKSDNSADLLVNGESNIRVLRGDEIAIPLKTEPNSSLTVEHWLGDSLLGTSTWQVTGSEFVFKVIPQTGVNRIVFTLTDKFNNKTTAEVTIRREKPVRLQPAAKPAEETQTEVVVPPVQDTSAIAKPVIAEKEALPAEVPAEEKGGACLPFMLILLGIAIIFFIFFFYRRRKKREENK